VIRVGSPRGGKRHSIPTQ